MLQFFDTMTDDSGNSLLGATVTVTNYPSGSLASIYSTNGTANPIPTAVVTADITGQVSFYAPDGAYTLTYAYKGTNYKVRSPVQFGDPLSFVAATDTGTAGALIVAGAQYPAQKYVGLKLEVKVAATNTGAATLNYQSDGGFAVNQPGGAAVPGGVLPAGGLVRLEWDGTQWQLFGGVAAGAIGMTPAEIAAGATIVNWTQLPGTIDRYGTNTTPGTTVMNTGVQAAVNQSLQPGGSPVVGNSIYLTTASIANLHSAPKGICTGSIQRGTTQFYLFPSGSQTNTINVAASGGNDANDGLGTGQAMATWQAALNAHQFYELALSVGGNGVIQLGAGTWTAGCTFNAGFWTKNPIQILGVAGTLPFSPTSILNNPASGFGVVGNGNNNVLLQDLLFTNCNNAGNGFAIVFQGDSHGKLQLYHIYTSSCDNALKAQQMRLYVGQACWFEGGSGQAMVTCISNITHTFGYNCSVTAAVGGANKGQANVGLYMHGHTVTGILVQESATGHFDYSCADNCAIGADITNVSRLNCNFSAFGNNVTCARRLREGSNWNDNQTQVNDTGNGTSNLLDGGCGEFSRQGFWTIPRTQPVDLTFITNTGVLGSTVVKTYAGAVDLQSFNQKQQRFRVRVVGTTAGNVNTKNLALNLDGSAVSGFTLAAAAAGDFIWDTVCGANGTGAQTFDSEFRQNGQLVEAQQGSRSITLTAGTLTIAEIINGAGDTISIRAVYIFSEGGA